MERSSMKLFIYGSDSISDPIAIRDCIDHVRDSLPISKILTKGKNSVDEAVIFYCEKYKIDCSKFKYNKFKGDKNIIDLISDLTLVNECDKGLVIWDRKDDYAPRLARNLLKVGKLEDIILFGKDFKE